ncbi:hypothetical protein FALCPG4_018717 [Fusarium falciforme]
MDATKNSVAYNWASYQVVYGGMAQNGKIDGAADVMSAMPPLEDGTMGFKLISWVTNKIQGLAAETIATGLIFVGVAMLIIGWSVAGQKDMPMGLIVLGLDCSNVVALATARFVSWKTSTPRSDTAPAVATWAVLTSTPSFMLKIIINNDSGSGDPSLLARHIVEDTFGTIKAWLADVGEVVEDIKVKAIAKGLGYVCITVQVVMRFADFYLQRRISLRGPSWQVDGR